MLVNSLNSFFCELKPTLLAQQYTVKNDCSFFVQAVDGENFDINGYSNKGLEKSGQLTLIDQEVGERELHLEGTFVESGKIVHVLFKASFLDVDVVFGSGVWEEKINGNIRQKYSVIIRGSEFLTGEKKFVDHLIEAYASVKESYKEVEDKVSDASNEVSDLSDQVADLSASVSDFLENEKELANALDDVEKLTQSLREKIDNGEYLIDQLDKHNARQAGDLEKINALNKKASDILTESNNVKERADKALSSSITVSLAKSFKDRKKEAVRQRWVYDVVFLLSLAVGIAMTYSMFGQLLPDGKGLVANLEGLISRLPFLMFFVWLGLFASKKSSHASRIEEFYAQKQTLAESYEGYKGEIARMTENSSELEKLMAINLVSISQDSGQIFDGARKEKHLPLEIFTERLLDKISLKKKDDPRSDVETHHKTDE